MEEVIRSLSISNKSIEEKLKMKRNLYCNYFTDEALESLYLTLESDIYKYVKTILNLLYFVSFLVTIIMNPVSISKLIFTLTLLAFLFLMFAILILENFYLKESNNNKKEILQSLMSLVVLSGIAFMACFYSYYADSVFLFSLRMKFLYALAFIFILEIITSCSVCLLKSFFSNLIFFAALFFCLFIRKNENESREVDAICVSLTIFFVNLIKISLVWQSKISFTKLILLQLEKLNTENFYANLPDFHFTLKDKEIIKFNKNFDNHTTKFFMKIEDHLTKNILLGDKLTSISNKKNNQNEKQIKETKEKYEKAKSDINNSNNYVTVDSHKKLNKFFTNEESTVFHKNSTNFMQGFNLRSEDVISDRRRKIAKSKNGKYSCFCVSDKMRIKRKEFDCSDYQKKANLEINDTEDEFINNEFQCKRSKYLLMLLPLELSEDFMQEYKSKNKINSHNNQRNTKESDNELKQQDKKEANSERNLFSLNFLEISNLMKQPDFLRNQKEKSYYAYLGTFICLEGKRYKIYFKQSSFDCENALDFVAYDFTDMSKLERRISNYKTNMIAKISHELKTPITTIMALIKKLQKNNSKNYLISYRSLSKNEHQRNSCSNLIEDMHSFKYTLKNNEATVDNFNYVTNQNFNQYTNNFFDYEKILSKNDFRLNQIENLCEYINFFVNDLIEFSNIEEANCNSHTTSYKSDKSIMKIHKDNAGEGQEKERESRENEYQFILQKEKETLKSLKKEQIDFKEVAQYCKKIGDTLLETKNKANYVRIYIDVSNQIKEIKLSTEAEKLKQILLNFISNSIKYTKAGFICIKIYLEMCVKEKSEKVKISVIDSGIGIGEKNLKNLFNENLILNSDKNYNESGSGHGLIIVKMLAQKLQCSIEVKSESNKGSEFSLLFDSFQSELEKKDENMESPIAYKKSSISDNKKTAYSPRIDVKLNEKIDFGGLNIQDDNFLSKFYNLNVLNSSKNFGETPNNNYNIKLIGNDSETSEDEYDDNGHNVFNIKNLNETSENDKKSTLVISDTKNNFILDESLKEKAKNLNSLNDFLKTNNSLSFSEEDIDVIFNMNIEDDEKNNTDKNINFKDSEVLKNRNSEIDYVIVNNSEYNSSNRFSVSNKNNNYNGNYNNNNNSNNLQKESCITFSSKDSMLNQEKGSNKGVSFFGKKHESDKKVNLLKRDVQSCKNLSFCKHKHKDKEIESKDNIDDINFKNKSKNEHNLNFLNKNNNHKYSYYNNSIWINSNDKSKSEINSFNRSFKRYNSMILDTVNFKKGLNTQLLSYKNHNKSPSKGLGRSPNFEPNLGSCNTSITRFMKKEGGFILIVEDHVDIRNALKKIVLKVLAENNKTDIDVITGEDGVDILYRIIRDQASNNKIKCIITDENMNYINGSEAVRIIRNLEKANKIKANKIATITAFGDEVSKGNIKSAGVDVIMNKPVRKQEIMKLLKDFKII